MLYHSSKLKIATAMLESIQNFLESTPIEISHNFFIVTQSRGIAAFRANYPRDKKP